MTEITTPKIGTFCWAELSTTDVAAASAFYGGLFGWQPFEIQSAMGPYTFQRLGEKDVAGFHPLEPGQAAPPSWLAYVAVAGADEAVAKAAELDASVLAPVFEVTGYGRMAVLQDPQGAVFALWQPVAAGQNPFDLNEPGAPCWSELATRDTAAAEGFYTGLFGWGAKADTGGMPYTEWTTEGRSFGGMRSLEGMPDFIPPHWLIYFLVKDCGVSEARAGELGASILVPSMEIPGVGRFAVIRDPQGAVFALFQNTIN
jgi:hypothetical protein